MLAYWFYISSLQLVNYFHLSTADESREAALHKKNEEFKHKNIKKQKRIEIYIYTVTVQADNLGILICIYMLMS